MRSRALTPAGAALFFFTTLQGPFLFASSVQLNQPLPTTVRVCLFHARKPVRLGCTGPYDYMSLAGGKVVSGSTDQKVQSGRGRSLSIGGRSFNGDVLVAPVAPKDFLIINGRRYRGAIIFEPLASGRFDVVEQLDFEEYLYGVLPREMGPQWPIEALKAQAVVSRTYVLANRGSGRYDVASDVSSQVYGGFEDESPLANQAVQETRGEVLVDKRGNPIQAFFHSSCGGRTETPQFVWNSSEVWDYFSSVKDSYCEADPYYHWKLDISASTLKARLARAGVKVGDIKKIKADKRSPSDRVTVFAIYGSKKNAQLPGNRFRIAVGPETLRSTLLTDISKTRSGFHFEGRGWGHGVGLCQWGARGRALAGQRYTDIVQAYYPETSLVRGAVAVR
jgi:stage II sporulation protein D